jgi:hypothetical protein
MDQTEQTKRYYKDGDCFAKAKARGQKTFTLVEQDLSAPATIVEWIKINIQNDVTPDDKLRSALEDALEMRRWNSRKHPD